MPAEKDNALRRVNGKQREPASPRNNVEERESCAKGKGKPAILRSGHYHPNPPILFTTWPTRNDHQTMNARSMVIAARIKAFWLSAGRRQQNQYGGSKPKPMATKSSLRSRKTIACQWRSRSKPG